MRPTGNPIICAVDTTDTERARVLCAALQHEVGAIKLGLEFFTANGAEGVHLMAAQSRMPIFLDLKFHDIPNTIAGAIRATAGIDAFMMTVHIAGGRDMLRAAIDASMEVAATTGKERPLIVGVTVLTSLDQKDLASIGVPVGLQDQTLRLADLAQKSGLDGVVCSPQEISLLRKHCGGDFTLVVPGIRPAGSQNGDQKRVLTPKEALQQGADYLVIGRPITGAENPKDAVRQIRSAL